MEKSVRIAKMAEENIKFKKILRRIVNFKRNVKNDARIENMFEKIVGNNKQC